jgi:hypothetical protein
MTTGKGLLGQDIRDGKSWTGQPGQESLDGTAGEDCRGGTGRKERGQSGKNMTARKGQLGQHNCGMRAMTIRSRQDIWNMTLGVTRGHDSPDSSVWTGRPDRSAWTGQREKDGQDSESRWAGDSRRRESELYIQDRKQRTERSENDIKMQDNREGTTVTGQPEQVKSICIGHSRQVSLNKTERRGAS